MSLHDIKQQIDRHNVAIAALEERRDKLKREYCHLRSMQFIELHGITLSDVQISEGEGVPYFGDIRTFSEWMKSTNCRKRFCEWNGRLYNTQEVINGFMEHDPPGRYEDLEGAK